MPPARAPLPIDPMLPALRSALLGGAAVLQAPPGAGKTTRVPLALLDAPWLAGSRIVMLEPRRLAARAAARRMAEELGEAIGDTVGYRVRHDTRVGNRTRIEVVTEGILGRMLQRDPGLEGIGLVIFDEFHERSVHADLGLALTLHLRSILREDLRVLVMSATLDGGPVAELLGKAPIVSSQGRTHPVETRYIQLRPDARREEAVARVVRRTLDQEAGDVLVFLPGAPEIRRVEEVLRGAPAEIIPLHGNLPPEVQDRAIRASPPGRRKVVLATSIAETSLTIEGVRVVVDSGLARVPRYSPRAGMTRLATVRVSRASADQRRGRAGRLGPGVCYRLWTANEDAALVHRATPEILEADLAPLALELAAAGVTSPAELSWLDPPPAAGFAQAQGLLQQLGAVNDRGGITAHGRTMASLALHPRLAHMVLRARVLGAGQLACELAALLSERDLLRRGERPTEADVELRLELLRGARRGGDVDPNAVRRARIEVRHCRERLGRDQPAVERELVSPGVLLAFAYPDRIAQRREGAPRERGGARYLLRNGLGGYLDPEPLAQEKYLAVAELDGRSREGRIALAAPITMEEIEVHFGESLEQEEVVEWDAQGRTVTARRRTRMDAIVLREGPLRDPNPEAVKATFLSALRGLGAAALPWNEEGRNTLARLRFASKIDPSYPDLSEQGLADALAGWLGPRLAGARTWGDLARLDLGVMLLDYVGWHRRAALEELAPTHVTVASGSRIPIDYSDPEAPVLAVRLQEMFGVTETPRIGGGRVPLTLHLLSPARRPVQVTRDLAGFWRTTYFDVRKDLRSRYPRHHWPDDPLQAEPTRFAKRKK